MPKSVPNNQMRAFAMATAGAALASIAMMFVPIGILESITGSTGLSELVPAARSPLGDTARALIAFGAGAFTLSVLAYLLTRQDSSPAPRASPSVPAWEWAADEHAPSLMERLREIKLPSFALPKMPWHKGEEDITELADLPKLRNGDSHPDAPPRRPLVASQDLPVFEMSELSDIHIEQKPEVAAAPVAPDVIANVEALQELAPATTRIVVADIEPTLADMVEQLEAVVAERQRQLSELEAVAIGLVQTRSTPRPMGSPENSQSEVEIIDQKGIFIEPAQAERPPLEVVPSPAVKDDDMDSALAAALATLHRMNAIGR